MVHQSSSVTSDRNLFITLREFSAFGQENSLLYYLLQIQIGALDVSPRINYLNFLLLNVPMTILSFFKFSFTHECSGLGRINGRRGFNAQLETLGLKIIESGFTITSVRISEV